MKHRIPATVTICAAVLMGISTYRLATLHAERKADEAQMTRGLEQAQLDRVRADVRGLKGKGVPLAARDPKPTRARTLATPVEHEALDALRSGDWDKASRLIWDDFRIPSKENAEMARRLGNPNPEAPVGPSWDELEMDRPKPKPKPE